MTAPHPLTTGYIKPDYFRLGYEDARSRFNRPTSYLSDDDYETYLRGRDYALTVSHFIPLPCWPFGQIHPPQPAQDAFDITLRSRRKRRIDERLIGALLA